eukprot:3013557-Alexandrium_andersonii.AAC.1
MDDNIEDTADFEAPAGGEPRGPAAESGGQLFRDDITGAVLPPDLVAAARSEETRFMDSWGVWGVRPIS